MSYPETLPAEDPHPFDELKTGAEVAAFVYKRFGPGGLRDLLAHDGSMPLEREWVLEIANELNAAGLRKAASIATEIAAGLPSMTDMVFCPCMKPPYVDSPCNATNIAHWLVGEQRRQRERELKRQH